MKKIFCIVLSLALLFSFAGCKRAKETGAGTVSDIGGIDINAVDTVNNAYVTTEKALNSATALRFKSEVTLTVNAEGKTVKSVGGTDFKFLKGDALKVYNKTTVKNEAVDSTLYLYTDGTVVYGATAGATYNITSGYETNKYFNDLIKTVTVYDASLINPVNTKIVNTSGGGYGFVILYPVDKLPGDFEEIIGSQVSKLSNVKAKALKVSGIIDANGRLETQTVTYDFTYDYTVQVNDIDPDNAESGVPTTEVKTAEASLSVLFEYDYNVTEVKHDANIVLPSAEEEPLKEMSLADFQLLAALSGEVEGEDGSDSSDTAE
ncbi:MAG: hypothetical protein E7525_01720 [Ruminococcaceae bacterium]|nr:hypothetical protein [Oscillospiraceae bacterium]